jgi:hypothetical protein
MYFFLAIFSWDLILFTVLSPFVLEYQSTTSREDYKKVIFKDGKARDFLVALDSPRIRHPRKELEQDFEFRTGDRINKFSVRIIDPERAIIFWKMNASEYSRDWFVLSLISRAQNLPKESLLKKEDFVSWFNSSYSGTGLVVK